MSLLFVNMKFIEEEKILIKSLHELKEYTAYQLIKVLLDVLTGMF